MPLWFSTRFDHLIPVVRYLLYFVVLIAMYFIAWTASYVLFWVVRGDTIEFTYYFGYPFAAWTGGGIEGAPQLMLIWSVILFLPLAAILVLVLRRHQAHWPPEV